MIGRKIQLVENWYVRIRAVQAGHYQYANNLRKKNFLLGVPVVALTAIVGTSVFASLSEQNPSMELKIIVGLVSMLAATLASLQTFLNYSEQSAKHLDAATKLSSLKKEMEEKLVLFGDSEEGIDSYIQSVRERWTQITNEAPLISSRAFGKNSKKYARDSDFPTRRSGET